MEPTLPSSVSSPEPERSRGNTVKALVEFIIMNTSNVIISSESGSANVLVMWLAFFVLYGQDFRLALLAILCSKLVSETCDVQCLATHLFNKSLDPHSDIHQCLAFIGLA